MSNLSFERTISPGRLMTAATTLHSEGGENPEYDRALYELCTLTLGGTADDVEYVAKIVRDEEQRPCSPT